MEVVGVIHLPRLPYSDTLVEFDLDRVVESVLREASILEELGYDSVIVENYGDAPYPKRVRDPLALSVIALIVREVVKNTSLRVGVNILRNSGREAYAVAVATGARFIRVNALTETIVSDSGVIEPEAPRLRAIRSNYRGVEVYADILVKHAGSLTLAIQALAGKVSGDPLALLPEIVRDAVERGGADKVVATGLRTGEAPDPVFVKRVRESSPVPVILGSGATPENIGLYKPYIDGVIVGSYIKRDGRAGNPVDPGRAEKFIKAVRSLS
ncbi:BtpA/SgcQ family protein [Thermogladius sp. 4427co]|uniref:BtpA/SgcQ family protein n=1 Tax=Thermogladius sp. 4427co TaxID=3450718 RepID=UPI003F78CDA2